MAGAESYLARPSGECRALYSARSRCGLFLLLLLHVVLRETSLLAHAAPSRGQGALQDAATGALVVAASTTMTMTSWRMDGWPPARAPLCSDGSPPWLQSCLWDDGGRKDESNSFVLFSKRASSPPALSESPPSPVQLSEKRCGEEGARARAVVVASYCSVAIQYMYSTLDFRCSVEYFTLHSAVYPRSVVPYRRRPVAHRGQNISSKQHTAPTSCPGACTQTRRVFLSSWAPGFPSTHAQHVR